MDSSDDPSTPAKSPGAPRRARDAKAKNGKEQRPMTGLESRDSGAAVATAEAPPEPSVDRPGEPVSPAPDEPAAAETASTAPAKDRLDLAELKDMGTISLESARRVHLLDTARLKAMSA